MRPEDLARELGVDAKRLRSWLRARWPRTRAEHGLPWFLTPDQVAEARTAFAARRAPAAPRVVRRAAAPAALVPARWSGSAGWRAAQNDAAAILASGVASLVAADRLPWGSAAPDCPGVYAVDDRGRLVYVGESTSVAERLAQHAGPDSRLLAALGMEAGAPLATRLGVRLIAAEIGRLELEEAAIASLAPALNRMRLASSAALDYRRADAAAWAAVQSGAAELLAEGAADAASAPGVPWLEAAPPRAAGLYILRDGDQAPLYVGESDALEERLRTHAAPRSYFSALRRHVGIEVLGLRFAPGTRRGFSPGDEARISAYLSSCGVAIIPLALGRWELERELVHALGPALNHEHAGEEGIRG